MLYLTNSLPAWIADNFVAVVCFVTVIVYFLLATKRPRNFPPGPRGVPLLGVAPYVGTRMDKAIAGWRKTYGDIMGFKVGSDLTVVLNNYELMQEALSNKAMVFSDRPDYYIFKDILLKTGISISDYTSSYVKDRKFYSTSLSKLGFGKTSMENIIVEESRAFVKLLGEGSMEFDEKAKKHLMNSIANIICQVLIGKRYDCDDPEFTEWMNGVIGFFSGGELALRMTYISSWTRYIPAVRRSLDIIVQSMVTIDGIVQRKIDQHIATLDENNPRDFIDEYLIEKKTKCGGSLDHASGLMLVATGKDLFGAGLETTSNTLIFLFVILANRPEVQKQMHEEIECVLGSDGIPKYARREEMPFCQAVLKESMRYRTVAPTAIPHRTSANVKLRGYDIPKGTTVIPNIYAVHNDPAIWDEPEVFKPERHLDANGRIVSSKYLIPFGIGARACIGRRLAEVELFVFMITILQRFRIVPSIGGKCPEDSDHLGMTLQAPDDVNVSFVPL